MRNDSHLVEQEEVMAYLDGELPVEEAARAAAHLEACHQCQALAAELKDVSLALTAWEIEPCNPQVRADMATALEEQTGVDVVGAGGGRNWFVALLDRPWAPFAAAAGVGALAMILVLMVPSNPSHNAAPQMALRVVPSEADRGPLDLFKAGPSAQRVVGGVPGGTPNSGAADIQLPATSTSPTARATGGKASAAQRTPMIARTAELALTTDNFDRTRAGLEEILRRHQGYVGDLNVASPAVGQRRLTATLRVPADQLEPTLAELKTLGRIESESQRGEEVTAQFVDLEARLANARTTEKRLTELERQHTGKLSEVLELETEISRVRGEIESMDAERKLLTTRVDFATITMALKEEFKAQAQFVPNSVGTRFRNAAIDGYQSVVNGVVEFLLFLISYGPSILLSVAVMFFPVRWLWRRLRSK